MRGLWVVGLLPWLPGCGATEVVLGEAPGVARVVAGVLRETHAITFPDSARSGEAAAKAPTASPGAVVTGPDGAAYIAETANPRAIRIGADGRVRTVAGDGTPGDVGDGGPAAAARLRSPAGLGWIGDTFYVAAGGNHRIRRVIAGDIHAFAGLGAEGFAGDRGPAASALFRNPGALAVGGTLLFVADRGNHRLRLIRLGPDSIDTFAGTGSTMPGPDLLEADRTGIAGPAGVAVGGRAVFVSDLGGHVVRRVVR